MKTRGGMSLRIAVIILLPAAAFLLIPPSTALSGSKKVRLRTNSYYYSAFNRRDPFASLIAGEFVKNKKMSPVNLNSVELVGIVKGDLDRFALLEDDNGFNYILRVGNEVRHGRVVAIGDRSLVARITNFGQTTKLTLHLSKREEGEKR